MDNYSTPKGAWVVVVQWYRRRCKTVWWGGLMLNGFSMLNDVVVARARFNFIWIGWGLLLLLLVGCTPTGTVTSSNLSVASDVNATVLVQGVLSIGARCLLSKYSSMLALRQDDNTMIYVPSFPLSNSTIIGGAYTYRGHIVRGHLESMASCWMVVA